MDENPLDLAKSSDALTSLLHNKNSRQMALKIVQQLKDLSDLFSGLSDDDKKIYSGEMKDKFMESLRELKNVVNDKNVVKKSADFLPFFTVIVILVMCFVFFGYKLYKSLVEKERKREEKLKAKQMKKKK